MMSDSLDAQELDDFTGLFVGQYAQLVRLAALLLGDLAAAEDVAQEAFIRVHRVLGGGRVQDPLAYLRQTVVNLSRSDLRRRLVARRHAPKPMPDVASAEEDACAVLARREVVQALRALPARQREAVVLRYWADLPVAQVAQVMGISTGAVKAYTSRGLGRLGELLGES
jgi:RNA polymerase sigma-70 factor (sigma-E family)